MIASVVIQSFFIKLQLLSVNTFYYSKELGQKDCYVKGPNKMNI